MTSHSASKDDGIYSSSLALSANQWLEQLTTDIPFLAVGIVALACVTCLLLTQRLSIPSICVLTSAFFAFNGAIFDFSRLLQVAKDTTHGTSADSGPFAIIVLREISFALSISLNYLFFLVYLGRPPRGEVKLVEPAERARARRESPSRWAYWGVFGYMIQGALGAAILSVAVLEVIWRVTEKSKGAIYMADGIIQGVLSLSFLGKILLNTYLSPLLPRWKTARDYSPLIFALGTRLGLILTSEFSIGFTESSLGRLLQAIQLYILLVFLLVSPFYISREADIDPPEARRASSFRGLRFSNVSRWSALNTNPGNQTTEFQPNRGSPSKRLSSWLNNRLATRKDPQEDRLWNKDKPDLEAPATPGDRNLEDNDGSPIEPRFNEKPPQATWQGPYLPEPISPAVTTSNPTTPNPGQVINITARVTADSRLDRAPTTSKTPPGQVDNSGTSSESKSSVSKFVGRFEINESYESDSDSPVYGINGIIQRKAKRNERKRMSKFAEDRASAIYQLKKEQEELERSVASMAAFSPSKSDFSRKTGSSEAANQVRPDSNAILAPSFLNGGLSESVRSDFSLRDFPSPPASLFADSKVNNSSSRPLPVPKARTPNTNNTITTGEQGSNELEIVEDVQFAMVPPRMPAAYQRRRASFPAVARESATSSMDGMTRIISAYADSEDDVGGKRVRMSSANNRLDVTSFIGELTTPQVGRAFISGRDLFADARLSPLPEDSSPRPSVEIIDMRLKSPTFTPAIAISTNDRANLAAARVPKVSFAPVTYDPSTRPKMKATPILLNTLPSSPRPAASPGVSPSAATQFKPMTSSPLASNNPDTSTGVSGRGPASKGTYPGFSGSTRPFISSPMPLRSPGEKDYQSPRRAPNPIRTQRFL